MRSVQGISLLVAFDQKPNLLLPGFDLLPEVLFDDPKVWYRGNFPLIARVGSGNPFAGARTLYIAAAVPFELTGIKGVIENAGAPFGLAADRRIAPRPAARAWNELQV
jgi:hypothetical protein